MQAYAKAIVATAGAALVALQVAISDGGVSADDWIKIGIATLTAIGVYLVPNVPASGDQVDVL